MQGKEHAVLATLHRKQSQLSSALNKIFKIDDHMGIAVSGVAADGRVMTRFMRSECLNHRCACCLVCVRMLLRALHACA